jgi:hypothetical protein
MPNPIDGLKNAQGRPFLGGAQTIQAAPPGDIDPSEIMKGEIPLMGIGEGLRGALGGLPLPHPNLSTAIEEQMQSGLMRSEPMQTTAHVPPNFTDSILSPGAKASLQRGEERIVNEGLKYFKPAANAAYDGLKNLYQNVTAMPKPGGVLSEVLERAGLKSGMGQTPTPGEARLLEHYSKLIR